MAKRLICAILVTCFSFGELSKLGQPKDTILNGGQQEEIVVNANKVNQDLTDLTTGTSGSRNRLTINYNPMNCQVNKWRGNKFYGTLLTSGTGIVSEDICISMCWQYKQQGQPCHSVNYIESQKKCELMQNAYDSANSDFRQDASCVYMVPIKCQTPGQPDPAPAPGPGPQPQPGNKIPPYSCGQTSVPNRVTRVYLNNATKNQRIVGGNEARPHSVPWIVSLRLKSNWHFCGGTLVRVSASKDETDIVVTAAHCMNGWIADYHSPKGIPNFDVVAGAHFISTRENGEEPVAVTKVVNHPSYHNEGVKANDIAILKLSRPIKFTSTIQPACLPEASEVPAVGANGIVAGWGGLSESLAGPDALNQVVVPVVSSDSCKKAYQSFMVPEAMLCAGYDQGGKDSCQGDSGGPYVFEGRKGFTLHGVVSFGSGCARPGKPGVYARVTNYASWIQSQIRALSTV